MTLARWADVHLDGLAAAGVLAGVVEVAAPRRAGAAWTAAVPVADPDVVGERATREPGVRVGCQPAPELVAVGPGIRDLGHTQEHARGGETVEVNIGPACKRHHPDKDKGWSLAQPEPGLFRWISPLGRTYWTRGEPIRPDLPDPDPAPARDDETASEIDQRLRRHEPRILDRPDEDPSGPPPPPDPRPPPQDDPPF